MKNSIKKGGTWLENVIYKIHAKGYLVFHYSKGCVSKCSGQTGNPP